MYYFCTGRDLCAANLHHFGVVLTDKCECGLGQTLLHSVKVCPMTVLSDAGLQICHLASSDNAVNWLDRMMMKTLMKQMFLLPHISTVVGRC